jgi:hypothetical protein
MAVNLGFGGMRGLDLAAEANAVMQVWISASADANDCVKTAHQQPGVGQPRRVVPVAAQIILSGAALAARVDAISAARRAFCRAFPIA